MESGIPKYTLSNTNYSNNYDYDDIFENAIIAKNFDDNSRLEH